MYDWKGSLEIRQRSREHAKLPLERVYMDMMSLSIPSMEGYNYALIIVDGVSTYRWVHGLKERVMLMLRLENGFVA